MSEVQRRDCSRLLGLTPATRADNPLQFLRIRSAIGARPICVIYLHMPTYPINKILIMLMLPFIF